MAREPQNGPGSESQACLQKGMPVGEELSGYLLQPPYFPEEEMEV